MIKKIGVTGVVLSALFPLLAFAQALSNIESLIDRIEHLIVAAVPLLIAIAVVYFIIGVIKYVTAGEAEDKTAARNYIIWGIVVIFVITSVWGLVHLLSGTFQLNNTPPVVVPIQTTN